MGPFCSPLESQRGAGNDPTMTALRPSRILSSVPKLTPV